MRAIHCFTIHRTAGSNSSELIFNGQPSSAFVAGVCLEGQWKTGEHFLLILSDDCPTEEVLHIFLLDSRLCVLDAVDFGAPYQSGVIGDIKSVQERSLEFAWNGTEVWRIHVLDKPRRGWFLERFGAIRYRSAIFAKHWLRLERVTKPM